MRDYTIKRVLFFIPYKPKANILAFFRFCAWFVLDFLVWLTLVLCACFVDGIKWGLTEDSQKV